MPEVERHDSIGLHHGATSSMTLRTELPDSFSHLLPNNNFHCQTALKNATFDFFCSEKCQLATVVENRDWLL